MIKTLEPINEYSIEKNSSAIESCYNFRNKSNEKNNIFGNYSEEWLKVTTEREKILQIRNQIKNRKG